MSTAVQLFTKVMGYRSDISPFTAFDPEIDLWQFDLFYIKLHDFYTSSLQFDFLATSCFLIDSLSTNFNSRMGRRELILNAHKRCCSIQDIFICQKRIVKSLVNLSF